MLREHNAQLSIHPKAQEWVGLGLVLEDTVGHVTEAGAAADTSGGSGVGGLKQAKGAAREREEQDADDSSVDQRWAQGADSKAARSSSSVVAASHKARNWSRVSGASAVERCSCREP